MKKIEYWTCPNCQSKNPLFDIECTNCGYSIEDNYTQEELDDIQENKNQKEERDYFVLEVIAVSVVTAYALYKISKLARKANSVLNLFKKS